MTLAWITTTITILCVAAYGFYLAGKEKRNPKGTQDGQQTSTTP